MKSTFRLDIKRKKEKDEEKNSTQLKIHQSIIIGAYLRASHSLWDQGLVIRAHIRQAGKVTRIGILAYSVEYGGELQTTRPRGRIVA
jgi:hypothetical protein